MSQHIVEINTCHSVTCSTSPQLFNACRSWWFKSYVR